MKPIVKTVGIAFSLSCFILPVYAQNATMYFMDHSPQNILLNPAFSPNVKFYLTAGGTSFNVYNSGFNFKEFQDFVDNLGSEEYNPDEFIHSIGEYNKLRSDIQANLFSIGLKLNKKTYLSVALSMNSLTELRAASKIAYLLTDFNDLSTSTFPLTIDGIDLKTNNYLSFGFTYSRKITEHLSLGISPHLNLNLVGINTRNLSYTVNRDQSDYDNIEYKTSISGEATLGLPFDINPKALNGDILNFDENIFPDNLRDYSTLSNLLKNKSFSFDIGGTYKLKTWTLSASILNVGSLNWQTNGYNIQGDGEDIIAKKTDKIAIPLPKKIFVGLSQQFAKRWNLGVLYKNTAYYWEPEKTATFSLNGSLGKVISTSFSYTAGSKYNDFGVGLRIRTPLGLDTYFVSENISQLFHIQETNRLTFAFGMNIAFGLK